MSWDHNGFYQYLCRSEFSCNSNNADPYVCITRNQTAGKMHSMILYSLYKNLKTPNYNIFLYSLYKNAPYHYNPCRKSFDKCLAKKIKPFIIEPEKVDARGFYRCKVNDWDRFAEIILTHDK